MKRVTSNNKQTLLSFEVLNKGELASLMGGKKKPKKIKIIERFAFDEDVFEPDFD